MNLDMEELLDTLSACVEHQQSGDLDEARDAGTKLVHLLGLSNLLRETEHIRLGNYTIYAPAEDGEDDEDDAGKWCVYHQSGDWMTDCLGAFPSRKAAMATIMRHQNARLPHAH